MYSKLIGQEDGGSLPPETSGFQVPGLKLQSLQNQSSAFELESKTAEQMFVKSQSDQGSGMRVGAKASVFMFDKEKREANLIASVSAKVSKAKREGKDSGASIKTILGASSNVSNGQLVPIKPPAFDPRYTAVQVKSCRPDTYKRVTELLAQPRDQVSYEKIEQTAGVNRRTIAAIEHREREEIAQRKDTLKKSAFTVAQMAADQVEEDLASGKLSPNQKTIVFGVFTEKALLLNNDPTAVVEVNPGPGFADLYDRINSLHSKLSEPAIEAECVQDIPALSVVAVPATVASQAQPQEQQKS